MLLVRLATLVCAAVMILHVGIVRGQDYPNKTIRLLTTEPGSNNDLLARVIAQGLSASFGQSAIVENRGGAGGTSAAELVAKAPPDGYTLLVYGPPVWLAPFLRDNVPYDPVKDFTPITLASTSPGIVVVHPSVAAGSIKELIALAKARPGELNYGSGGTGATNHLAAELFKHLAGVHIVRIPYKGAAQALNDLVGGQLQLMFPVMASGMPHVRSGKLRALAVTTAEPSQLAPGLPTVAASGLPGYEAGGISSVFAPAKVQLAIVNRLNQEILRVLGRTDIKERLFNAGVEVIGSSPERLAAAIKADMSRMGKVIKDAGIREE